MAAMLLAFIKAIPPLVTLLTEMIDLYYKQQDVADENASADVLKQREQLIADMKTPGLSDISRATLRRKLWELGKK